MDRWQNKVAVVTGASSGIGAAIVKEFINAGLEVIGLARRVERVEELRAELPVEKQKKLHAYKCDVSQLKSVNEAFDWIIKNFGGVDVLVNNAGTFQSGRLVDLDIGVLEQVLQTNVMSMVYCTQRAFKSMKERKFDGHVFLLNSVVGHKISVSPMGPVSNIYAPSKYAITAITEIYRQEFSALETKVKVTSISPGLVNTEIVPARIKEVMGERILQPSDISNAILFALSTPPHVQIHELTIKPVGEMF